jgi:putative redox protein
MKARIEWVDNVKFVGHSESGHQITIDTLPKFGGSNEGASPMELLLLGVGGCSSVDVVNILKKQRQQVSGCVAELVAERADSVPKVFTSIHLHFIVKGGDLRPEKVSRAVKLSAEKYCSASIMLARGDVKVTHDFEIIEDSK